MTTRSEIPVSIFIAAGIDFRNLVWVALVLAAMIVSILIDPPWLLRFIHVVTGVLWTGSDILLGFLIGPIVRRMEFDARRRFSLNLLPKTLFIMSTLGVVAPTSGWYLAVRMGYLDLAFPAFWWVVAALVVAGLLAIVGLGIILPANVISYLEFRKDEPDAERVGRVMKRYYWAISVQALLQVSIIVIMVRMTIGL